MLCCRKVEDTQKDARKFAKVNSFPFLPLPLKKESWKRQPTPVFLPGKSHGQRSLMGYSPWRRKRVSDNLATKQQQFSFKSSNY